MHEWAVQLQNVATGTSALDVQKVEEITTQWDTLVPDHDEFDSSLTSAALDAALTLTYATDAAVSESVDDAVNAGHQAMTLADMLTQESENMHPQDSQLEEKILAHPLMQAELQRQIQALCALESGDELIAPSVSGAARDGRRSSRRVRAM